MLGLGKVGQGVRKCDSQDIFLSALDTDTSFSGGGARSRGSFDRSRTPGGGGKGFDGGKGWGGKGWGGDGQKWDEGGAWNRAGSASRFGGRDGDSKGKSKGRSAWEDSWGGGKGGGGKSGGKSWSQTPTGGRKGKGRGAGGAADAEEPSASELDSELRKYFGEVSASKVVAETEKAILAVSTGDDPIKKAERAKRFGFPGQPDATDAAKAATEGKELEPGSEDAKKAERAKRFAVSTDVEEKPKPADTTEPPKKAAADLDSEADKK